MTKRAVHGAALPVLAAATLTAMLPNSVLIPGFREIGEGLGVPYERVGLLVTSYTLAYVVATPFTGVLADRWGRRAVLAPALVLFGSGGLVPVVTTIEPLVLLGRAVMGIGGAGILTVVFALLGDLYDGASRDRATGVVSATLAVADAAVPFLGGLLAALHWLAPFLTYLVAFPTALAVLLVVPRTRAADPATLRTYLRRAAASFRRPALVGVYAATFLLAFTYFGVLTLLPLLAAARWGGGSVLAGGLILVFGIAWAAAAWALPRLPEDRRAGAILLGLLLPAPAVGGVLLVPQLTLVTLPLILWGVGTGGAFTGLVDRMTREAGARHRGAVAGLFNGATLVGLGLGPVAFARVAGGFVPFRGAILLAASASLASAIAFRWGDRGVTGRATAGTLN